MLSLAIGREGQNARLAARLTGWRIDIRSDVSVAEAKAAARARAGRRRRARPPGRGRRRGRERVDDRRPPRPPLPTPPEAAGRSARRQAQARHQEGGRRSRRRRSRSGRRRPPRRTPRRSRPKARRQAEARHQEGGCGRRGREGRGRHRRGGVVAAAPMRRPGGTRRRPVCRHAPAWRAGPPDPSVTSSGSSGRRMAGSSSTTPAGWPVAAPTCAGRPACLTIANTKGALSRALETPVPTALLASIDLGPGKRHDIIEGGARGQE